MGEISHLILLAGTLACLVIAGGIMAETWGRH